MCVYVLHSWFLECIFHHAFVFWGHATFIFWIMSDCLELHWGIAIALISFQHATVRCATKTPWSPFIPQFINHLAQIKWKKSGAFLRWNHRSRTRDKCTACFFHKDDWAQSQDKQTSLWERSWSRWGILGRGNSSFLPPLLSFYDHCVSLYLFKACRKYPLTLGVSGKRKRADVTSTQGQRRQGNRAPWFLHNSHNFEVCHILLCFLQLHC